MSLVPSDSNDELEKQYEKEPIEVGRKDCKPNEIEKIPYKDNKECKEEKLTNTDVKGSVSKLPPSVAVDPKNTKHKNTTDHGLSSLFDLKRKNKKDKQPKESNAGNELLKKSSNAFKIPTEKLQTSVSNENKNYKHKSMRQGKLPSNGTLNISSLDEFLARSKTEFEKLYNEDTVPASDFKISDFKIIKTIGQGTYGRVLLVELKEDNVLYAVKVIEKKEVLKRNYVRYVLNEKRILQSINFPFVIHLKCFFVDFKYMYFVMPFVPGGDFNLYLWLHKEKEAYLKESHAKFYIGQLILALEYLHYMGLIHRDIKPENILMDAYGYIKLADFGQCIKCHSNDKTWTTAGTPEYMAPEVIVGQGYDCAADWWSLGVITYYICAGQQPFVSDNINGLYRLILMVKYTIPEHFSRQLKTFVKGLLVNDPSNRVANRKYRASKIKLLSWIKGTDWLSLLNRTIKAPSGEDISKLQIISQ